VIVVSSQFCFVDFRSQDKCMIGASMRKQNSQDYEQISHRIRRLDLIRSLLEEVSV